VVNSRARGCRGAACDLIGRMLSWAPLVTGTLLPAIIGLAGKFTEQPIATYAGADDLALPRIEYVLWALAFGLLVSNNEGIPRIGSQS
jgi:hypothetical protein